MKGWNISYAEHDGYGGLSEGMIVLPSWWKVLWWFLRKAHRYCEIYIWVSHRMKEENKRGNNKADTEFGI